MPHVVLLGDSILDNGAYTGGGPDVVTQLRGILPSGWKASLAAVDGAVASSLPAQLARLPDDATHFVVSAGGNDALGHTDLLERAAQSSAQVLLWLAEAASAFERRYRDALATVLARGVPTAVCTIYSGDFPDREFQRVAGVALTAFNDVILRAAFERGLQVIDLRLICNESADYANPIEPSSHGGAKIADAIARAVGARQDTAPRTAVVAAPRGGR